MIVLFEDIGIGLKSEQIDNCVDLILKSIKNELPKEAHCIEVYEYILNKSKEKLRFINLNL